MFDLNLTRETARVHLEDVAEGVHLETAISDDIISFYRETEKLRMQCFSDEESYRRNFGSLQEVLKERSQKFFDLEIFQFLCSHYSVYTQAGALQSGSTQAIMKISGIILDETIINALSQSDNVGVSLSITPRGLLIDVNQGNKTFHPEFIEDMKVRASFIYDCLMKGSSRYDIMRTMKNFRTSIGYVPQKIDVMMEDLPFRGNELGNILVNELYRTNFIRGMWKIELSLCIHYNSLKIRDDSITEIQVLFLNFMDQVFL
ncbi:MAG: hypothetical protein AABX16_01415 [Nanoarchaeota archaeon]|mgnify:CR=1 FL=1